MATAGFWSIPLAVLVATSELLVLFLDLILVVILLAALQRAQEAVGAESPCWMVYGSQQHREVSGSQVLQLEYLGSDRVLGGVHVTPILQ